MLKTGFKAFVYSFSVSLFAILSAHRAFFHDTSHDPEPLKITNKNIVLFLKTAVPGKSPVRKIALNTLPDISVQNPSLQENPESIVLANNSEHIDFPLEFENITANTASIESEKSIKTGESIALADVLYAPDLPQDDIKIEAEPIYQPESSQTLAPPKQPQKVVLAQDNHPIKEASASLQVGKAPLLAPAKAKIGSAQDLDHIALSEGSLPIESMKEDKNSSPDTPQQKKKWVPLNDDPWVVAYSNAGAKNTLAARSDASSAFIDTPKTQGIQIADETAKNIILPIPDKIMEDNNLTPKLAYPRDSEDAIKEKLIDAKIQANSDTQKEQEQTLLSEIDEEDVSLEAPKEEKTQEQQPIKKDETKENFLGKINSIFSQIPQKAAEVKEKAIAKAQARRSLKRKLARLKPVSIIPTEIRLSFQPNKAEISGQTLRWVQAFASKAAESTNTVLEIRIDGTSSPILQQRRLNLLHNILANKGVEYSKINTVFTSREPNSFILRTIDISQQEEKGEQQKINNQYTSPHRRW